MAERTNEDGRFEPDGRSHKPEVEATLPRSHVPEVEAVLPRVSMDWERIVGRLVEMNTSLIERLATLPAPAQPELTIPREQIDVILPNFHPERGGLSASEWIEIIETHQNNYRWSAKYTTDRASSALKGSAESWYKNWHPTVRDWNQFSIDLQKQYPRKRALVYRLRDALSYHSRESESLSTYATEKIRLCRMADIRCTESELVEIVAETIDSHVKTAINLYGVRTEPELMIRLNTYDQEVSNAKRVERRADKRSFPYDSNAIPRKRQRNNDPRKPETRACYNCEKVGHVQRDCPSLPSTSGKTKNTEKKLTKPGNKASNETVKSCSSTEPERKLWCVICRTNTHCTDRCYKLKPLLF